MIVPANGSGNGVKGPGGDGYLCPLQHNTIANYITTFLILYMCLYSERRPVLWVAHILWDNGVLDLE